MKVEAYDSFINKLLKLSEDLELSLAEVSNILINFVGYSLPEDFDEEDLRSYVSKIHKLFVDILEFKKTGKVPTGGKYHA
jgi:hypothetical protein